MPVDPRQKTWALAKVNVDEAYKYALSITDPWYRCQALASAGLHIRSKPRFLKVAKEAFKAASKLENPNRRVSCSAWIINAIAKRGDIDLYETIEESLTDINREDHAIRRADALLLLFEAVYSVRELRQRVYNDLWNAISEIKSWKKDKLLGDLALIVAVDDTDQALSITESIAKVRIKRKTLEHIENRQWLGPHDFFPHYAKITEAHPVR